jgi:RNA polymerase sigma-70 factor (ECF subfamily)
MTEDSSFENLMRRLRAGDEEAAACVFRRFAQQLIALARSRLDSQVRQKVDPEDVMQSVFRSFFTRTAEGQFELGSWDSLWGMLTIITVRKCGQRAKFFHAARRNVQREVSCDKTPPAEGPNAEWELPGREPTPAEAAMLAEVVEGLMRGLDESERPILVLELQGRSVPEISKQVGRTERTVQRVLRRMRQRLERMCLQPMTNAQ